MFKEFAISPRNVGAVNLEKFCPRCFKHLLEVRFQPPFKFGGQIFSDMQKTQEAVIGHFLQKNGKLPKEFAPFCNCVARADFPHHWSKYTYVHESGVRLYGAPDEIFECSDGTLCVIDLKTAHTKEKGDPFYPQYECQVIGYADIAENGLGLGEVSKAGLIYWEAQVADVQETPADHYSNGGLSVTFTPATKEIKVDYSVLYKALKEAHKIWKAKTMPDGRQGCDDCKKLDILFATDEKFQLQDRQLMLRYANVQSVRDAVLTRDYDRRNGRRALLAELEQMGSAMFSEDGVVANWEWEPGSPD